MGDCSQFLDIQLKAAVSIHAHRAPSAACQADADTGGDAEPHSAQAPPYGIRAALCKP